MKHRNEFPLIAGVQCLGCEHYKGFELETSRELGINRVSVTSVSLDEVELDRLQLEKEGEPFCHHSMILPRAKNFSKQMVPTNPNNENTNTKSK